MYMYLEVINKLNIKQNQFPEIIECEGWQMYDDSWTTPMQQLNCGWDLGSGIYEMYEFYYKSS